MLKKCPKATPLKILYKNFKETILGGTFDRLHIAHKGLISLTLDISQKAHIGVMDDEWIKKKGKDSLIQSFEERVENLKNFLMSIGELGKTTIVPLHDPYSYAIEDNTAKRLDSIVISSERNVLKRTIELNSMREAKGLKPLNIVKMPLVRDFEGKIISSTRLRSGKLRLSVFDLEFTFDEKTLSLLKEPQGVFYKNLKDIPYFGDCVIAIGDIVSESLINEGIPVSIAIVDRKSKRKRMEKIPIFAMEDNEDGEINVPINIPVINRKGTVSHQAFFSTLLALVQEDPVLIRVYGEEDLMGFPATIFAPNNAQIIYGEPYREGLVVIYVDEEVRSEAVSFMRKTRLQKKVLF